MPYLTVGKENSGGIEQKTFTSWSPSLSWEISPWSASPWEGAKSHATSENTAPRV
jgi:hypothetical protein